MTKINDILQELKADTSILLNCEELEDVYEIKIGEFT